MTLSTIIQHFPKILFLERQHQAIKLREVNWETVGKVIGTHSPRKNTTFKNQDGSLACKHIDNWEQDLDLVANAGFDAYRFSLSWPRILKDGQKEKNYKGISFYDQLIDGMLERGIRPFATLYHWDLPQALAATGGWTNRDTCEWFADYTELVMTQFGDRRFQ